MHLQAGELVQNIGTDLIVFENKNYMKGSLTGGKRRYIHLIAGEPYLYLGYYDNPKFTDNIFASKTWNAKILVGEEIMITKVECIRKYVEE